MFVELYKIPKGGCTAGSPPAVEGGPDDISTAAGSSTFHDSQTGQAYYIFCSSVAHDLTREFYPFTSVVPNMIRPSAPWGWPPMPPGAPPMPQNDGNLRQPTPAEMKPRPMVEPEVLQRILSFRKPQRSTIPLDVDRLNACATSAKRAQDFLCVTLLRAIHTIQNKGDVNAKLLLSRQSPMNELKALIRTANDLAVDAFEPLMPYFACVSSYDLDECENRIGNNVKPPEARISPCNSANPTSALSSVFSFCDPQDSANTFQSSTGMVNPQASQMPVASNVVGAAFVTPDTIGDLSAVTAPPYPGMLPPMMEHTGYFVPPETLRHSLDLGPPMGGGSLVDGGMSRMPYGMPPPNNSFQRLGDGRRKTMGGYDTCDVFASGTSKRGGPSIGDKPLTPPAQGWYAKYSSGVTGVVWDRVHQAWVVSWTLAGKRTFRHFTCKSYGGFDRAREAAIEFRLARNRDIAAYNKRSKETRYKMK